LTSPLSSVVQRFPSGDRIRIVVAASDAAYVGNAAPQPVTLTTSPRDPSALRLPLADALTF
jgi:ABC-2 type transport system ATP-binding protein